MFAKLFGEGAHQVLVMRAQDDDDAPVIRFITKIPGVGMYEVTTKYGSEERADEVFDKIDEVRARMAVAASEEIGTLFGQED